MLTRNNYKKKKTRRITKRKRVTRRGGNSGSKSLKINSLARKKQMLLDYFKEPDAGKLDELMGKLNSSKKNEEKEFGFLKLEERKPKKNFIAPWGEIIYHKKKTLKI